MPTPAPPTLPDDRLTGWRQVEQTTDTPFSIGPVSVTATTVVYEDERLRRTLRAATDIDDRWRFFFASRLAISPATPPSGALRRLVTDRARRGFRDRLRDRGFESPTERGRRTIRIDGTDAEVTAYDATCRLGDLRLSVVGWLAVWPDDAEFLLAGGAYPTAVAASGLEAGDDRGAADSTAALAGELTPDTFRDELFSLIRATR
ncbi:hypothetical protein [Salinirubrum litoreum]|uniref:CYTH domain-containing protein n=1 Tax=Salinirubrum litoreum TaxID=1126234 RepID=A0ABD5R9G5_9EURY|nr:hypothetical protein [Salinirubrum litoreum]